MTVEEIEIKSDASVPEDPVNKERFMIYGFFYSFPFSHTTRCDADENESGSCFRYDAV